MRAVGREKKVPRIIEVSLPPESRTKDPLVREERVEKGTLLFEQVLAVNGDKVVRFEVDKKGGYELLSPKYHIAKDEEEGVPVRQ